MRVEDSSLVTLAAGAQVIRRGEETIQFGLDATRSGIIESPAAAHIAAALAQAAEAIRVDALCATLAGGDGMDEQVARSLIDDLVAYRVLIPSVERVVLLMGTSALAQALREQLNAAGCTVRTPIGAERPSVFLRNQPAAAVLVVVDQIVELAAVGRAAGRREGWHVPVSVLDSRVSIGPLGRDGAGPCLTCAQLRLLDRDSGLGEALGSASSRVDPTVIAAGAAAAAAQIRELSGVPAPPGVLRPEPRPGALLTVDPFGPKPVEESQAEKHPLCAECHSEDQVMQR